MPEKIAVLGAGSWGTALALSLARNGQQVSLWSHRDEQVMQMQALLGNPDYLPGIVFPPLLEAVGDLKQLVADTDQLLIAVPSHAFDEICQQLKGVVGDSLGIAWATKGFAIGGQRLIQQVATEILGDRPMAMISGPSFAKEVALELPTALTVAANQAEFGQLWAGLLHGNNMRAYTSNDLTGVQVCGAVKNVLAIAAGVADGLGFGANARAAW
ncbi:MAG: NAD(P)H-dependent glycerol-3-phosphate dehydrogenase [Immundisolibacteraceae bacterium]|nr:NAD(P)H-dependent glycerol-3-phosphate dehydrogenase [Immundisolibacteraceae bacterium]